MDEELVFLREREGSFKNKAGAKTFEQTKVAFADLVDAGQYSIYILTAKILIDH